MASKVRKFKHTFNSTSLNSAPVQSAEIQTSLLQVGMRVRKSIGQGYRTQWAIEEEKLRSERLLYKKHNSTIVLWEEKPEKEDETNGFPASQESTTSTESSQSVTSHCTPILPIRRKRTLAEQEETGYNDEVMDAINTYCLRPIAQATSRMKLAISKNQVLNNSENIDNLADFEDATFLDPENHYSGNGQGVRA